MIPFVLWNSCPSPPWDGGFHCNHSYSFSVVDFFFFFELESDTGLAGFKWCVAEDNLELFILLSHLSITKTSDMYLSLSYLVLFAEFRQALINFMNDFTE